MRERGREGGKEENTGREEQSEERKRGRGRKEREEGREERETEEGNDGERKWHVRISPVLPTV